MDTLTVNTQSSAQPMTTDESDDIHLYVRRLAWDAFNAIDDLYEGLQELQRKGQFIDTLEDRLEDVEEMREWLGERTHCRSIELNIPDLSLEAIKRRRALAAYREMQRHQQMIEIEDEGREVA